jgi:hypothetical protein
MPTPRLSRATAWLLPAVQANAWLRKLVLIDESEG